MLSIPSVKTSGRPYMFQESELKDTWKQFTENLWTWKHLFFNFKQFDHHWKLLKALYFNTYQGFLFLFFIQFIPGYLNKFIYEIMEWNISKVKHHSYEVLNLQVKLIVNSWKPVILGGFLQRKGDFNYRNNAIFFYFYPLKRNFYKGFEP